MVHFMFATNGGGLQNSLLPYAQRNLSESRRIQTVTTHLKVEFQSWVVNIVRGQLDILVAQANHWAGVDAGVDPRVGGVVNPERPSGTHHPDLRRHRPGFFSILVCSFVHCPW